VVDLHAPAGSLESRARVAAERRVIRFDWPYALVLLAALPFVARASRAVRGAAAVLPFRLAALALGIVALASPHVSAPASRLNVVFAVDRSDSIAPAEWSRVERFVEEAQRARRPGDRLGLVSFGGDAVVEHAPSEDAVLHSSLRPKPLDSDLGAAIERALSSLPPDGGRRIVLVSDGNDHRGNALEAAKAARAAGVEISVLPLTRERQPEVLIDGVVAPPRVGSGEKFDVNVIVRSTVAQPAVVELSAGGRSWGRQRVSLPEGSVSVPFQITAAAGGWIELRASVDAERDTVHENQLGRAIVRVIGAPVVLYAGEGRLPEVLAAQGIRVERVTVDGVPGTVSQLNRYDAVVLDNVPATALSRGQMESLRRYVADLGGGLVAIGGPNSYGVGGYAGTALEQALPVSMDIRQRVALPSMAILLLLDSSGSMGELGQETAKVELAKETARSVVDLLSERDLIGVITFDQSYKWLVPLTPARNRQQILDQVSRLRAGGGTELYPPLNAAREALGPLNVKIKHNIVLSDGLTDPGEFERLVRQMRGEQMTLSAVSIGKDADLKFMKKLAEWGGGRHYHARDDYSVPQIFTAEALIATRSYIVEERFQPVRLNTELLATIPSVPPLRGYIASSAKPSAEVHLRSAQRDPILVSWQYGLGRAVAFTSDAVPRWAADWMTWKDFAHFWSQNVRWAMRSRTGSLDVRTEVQGASVRIAVDARDGAGDFMDGLHMTASVIGRGDEPVELRQTGPGWYEGRAELDRPGEYSVAIIARAGGRVVARADEPVVLSYSPELRDTESDAGLLGRIAEMTGGVVLTRASEAMARARGARDMRELWPYLLNAAAAAFLAEITVRRLPAAAAAIETLRRRLRRAPDAGDALYAEADRWKPTAEQTRSPSTDELARLYIARLKQSRKE
jgi:uncharacterized membrane protein/secreted protein with Ig-like and vWFA domain